jgi:hypothetical protein
MLGKPTVADWSAGFDSTADEPDDPEPADMPPLLPPPPLLKLWAQEMCGSAPNIQEATIRCLITWFAVKDCFFILVFTE